MVIDDKTVKKLWQQSSVSCQGHLRLWDYHAQPDRYQVRLHVIKHYYQGWEKVSINRFLHVSRPTVDAWIQRFDIRGKIYGSSEFTNSIRPFSEGVNQRTIEHPVIRKKPGSKLMSESSAHLLTDALRLETNPHSGSQDLEQPSINFR